MGINKRKLYKYLVIAVAAVFFGSGFWSCANVTKGPEGGPMDTIPPKVVGMSPKFNSKDINPKKITITLDEYIQLKDFQKEFFTSPFMDVRPTVLIKGRSVETTIKSDLDSATTYVLNYGSSIVDNNEGNPLVGLKYTFSTGSHIDSMYMTGLVQDSRTADTVPGAFIMFYDARADSVPEYDSLLFNFRNALAVGRTTPNGIFIHENLKPMDYRVYAVVDNNNNQMYDPGVDDVAFMDTVFNPANMPSFYMWYDTLQHYTVAEPQIFIRSFRETPDTRQILSGSERPDRQKIMLKFSSRNPVIERLEFRDIDPDKIIVEQTKETNDSILYWINIPYDELADTIYADITYMRHDSVGVLGSHSQELRFIHRKPFSEVQEQKRQEREALANEKKIARLERRRQKKLARQERKRVKRLMKAGITPEQIMMPADSLVAIDSVAAQIVAANLQDPETEAADSVKPASKMKYKFSSLSTLIPTEGLKLTFDLPVVEFEKDSVSLTRITSRRNEDVESQAAVNIVQDSMHIREYRIEADWARGDKYKLIIPEGLIRTIDGELNDTITHEFTVAETNKYASIILSMVNAHPDYEYIVSVYDGSGKNLFMEVPHLTEGVDTLEYVPPGKVSMRVVEDRNRNGKWDTGDIIKRVQPERVEAFVDAETGSREINMRANWEVKYTFDLAEIFKPKVHESTIDINTGEGYEGEDLQVISSGGEKAAVLIPEDEEENENPEEEQEHAKHNEGPQEEAVDREEIQSMQDEALVFPEERSEGTAFKIQQENIDEEQK